MKARFIEETDEIKAGDTLFDKHPNYPGISKVIVTKVTKTQIVTTTSRYTKSGTLIGDQFCRRRLYVAITE